MRDANRIHPNSATHPTYHGGAGKPRPTVSGKHSQGKHRTRNPQRGATAPQHRAHHSRLPGIAAAGVYTAASAALLVATTGTAAADDGGGGVNWDAIAACESGGNWATSTGNGFFGGLQFTSQTWHAFGGAGTPQNASREQQISVAQRVLAGQGIGAWPVCGAHAHDGPVPVSSSGKAPAPRHAAPSAPAVPLPRSTTEPKHAAADAAPPPEPSAAPPPAASQPPPTDTTDYTITAGDTLVGIADRLHIASDGATSGWQRIADANPDVITDPDVIHAAAHLRIPLAADTGDLLSQLSTGTTALTPVPAPVATPQVAPSALVTDLGAKAVNAARAMLGVPYVYGGTGRSGVDCSGLTQLAYRAAGVDLPRTAAAQASVGRPVSVKDLQPGDLLFFYQPVEHVVVFAGNGRIIEAAQSGTTVHERPMYLNGFVQARRIV